MTDLFPSELTVNSRSVKIKPVGVKNVREVIYNIEYKQNKIMKILLSVYILNFTSYQLP